MTLESPRLFSKELPPFDLKGSLFTLTIMRLRQADQRVIAHHLAKKVKQAPGFFKNVPIVLDLGDMERTEILDFSTLFDLLRGYGMIPVGVRNGSAQLQAAAALAGLPVLPPEGRSSAGLKNSDRPEATPVHRNKTITHPVRSGQQIYAPDGDLILLGPISPGAEVLADGNIHIYGPLRGRALAGVNGDTEARIFCQSLEAELVSIAGRYRVIEELEVANQNKPVQIYLSEDRLIIEPLFR